MSFNVHGALAILSVGCNNTLHMKFVGVGMLVSPRNALINIPVAPPKGVDEMWHKLFIVLGVSWCKERLSFDAPVFFTTFRKSFLLTPCHVIVTFLAFSALAEWASLLSMDQGLWNSYLLIPDSIHACTVENSFAHTKDETTTQNCILETSTNVAFAIEGLPLLSTWSVTWMQFMEIQCIHVISVARCSVIKVPCRHIWKQGLVALVFRHTRRQPFLGGATLGNWCHML